MTRGWFRGAVAAVGGLAACLMLGCSTSTDVPPIGRTPQPAWNVDFSIPTAARPPAGHKLLAHAIGKGVQIYTCRQDANDQNEYEWVASGVDADLLDQDGHVIGRHFTGPTWTASDGSSVSGRVLASVPQRRSAPWLLLGSTSRDGRGMFNNVEYIQRVHTVGGRAPRRECTAADAGRETRVEYTADYYFYGPLTSH